MNLIVNGEAHELKGNETVDALIKEMGADAERIAVMVNDKVISRDVRSSTALSEGDKVELLTFAGGG